MLGKIRTTILIKEVERFDEFIAVILGDTLMENGLWEMIHDLEKKSGKHHKLRPS